MSFRIDTRNGGRQIMNLSKFVPSSNSARIEFNPLDVAEFLFDVVEIIILRIRVALSKGNRIAPLTLNDLEVIPILILTISHVSGISTDCSTLWRVS